MLKRATLISTVLLALVIGACSDQEPLTEAPYYTSLEEAQKVAADDDKYIVIKFYTDWCKWCKTLDTVVLVDSAAIEFFDDEMLLVKTDAEEDTALANRYNVRGFPTLVMVDAEGREVDRLVGYLPTEDFLKTFRDYAKGIGTLDDLVNRAEAAEEPDRDLLWEIADKYKYRGEGDSAMVWFQRVIEAGDPLDSLSGEARLAIADDLRRNDEHEEAIEAFRAVARDFENQPTAEEALVWIAITTKAKGDTTKALGLFRDFVNTHPNSRLVQYCQGQIDNITAPPKEDSAQG